MIVKGRTIVVIGAGPGLGREVASAALRDGANVGLCVERVAATYSSAGSPNTDAYSR